LTAQAVADLVGGRLSGPGAVRIHRVRSLAQAGEGDLSLCTGSKYAAALATSRATAVLVPEGMVESTGPATRIVVADPAAAIAMVSRALVATPPVTPSIDPTARIGAGSVVGENASIAAYAVIGANVRIGARVRLAPHVVIHDGATLGDDVRLDAHVTVYDDVSIGSRVWCQAGVVLGGVGFGYSSDARGHTRLPHPGGCIIEDDVEIGSGCCIDRGTLDDTVIGRGTKLDNLVHIAHNVRIGQHCLVMGQVGIAGSTHLGDRVILAGQVGVAGHLVLGNDVRAAAQSGVITSYPSAVTLSGFPARPHREFLRASAVLYRLAPHLTALEALIKERSNG
jgi:UDP-3-O-[3-hydroxymyristoyl] glucosamine N-acyltransferase